METIKRMRVVLEEGENGVYPTDVIAFTNTNKVLAIFSKQDGADYINMEPKKENVQDNIIDLINQFSLDNMTAENNVVYDEIVDEILPTYEQIIINSNNVKESQETIAKWQEEYNEYRIYEKENSAKDENIMVINKPEEQLENEDLTINLSNLGSEEKEKGKKLGIKNLKLKLTPKMIKSIAAGAVAVVCLAAGIKVYANKLNKKEQDVTPVKTISTSAEDMKFNEPGVAVVKPSPTTTEEAIEMTKSEVRKEYFKKLKKALEYTNKELSPSVRRANETGRINSSWTGITSEILGFGNYSIKEVEEIFAGYQPKEEKTISLDPTIKEGSDFARTLIDSYDSERIKQAVLGARATTNLGTLYTLPDEESKEFFLKYDNERINFVKATTLEGHQATTNTFYTNLRSDIISKATGLTNLNPGTIADYKYSIMIPTTTMTDIARNLNNVLTVEENNLYLNSVAQCRDIKDKLEKYGEMIEEKATEDHKVLDDVDVNQFTSLLVQELEKENAYDLSLENNNVDYLSESYQPYNTASYTQTNPQTTQQKTKQVVEELEEKDIKKFEYEVDEDEEDNSLEEFAKEVRKMDQYTKEQQDELIESAEKQHDEIEKEIEEENREEEVRAQGIEDGYAMAFDIAQSTVLDTEGDYNERDLNNDIKDGQDDLVDSYNGKYNSAYKKGVSEGASKGKNEGLSAGFEELSKQMTANDHNETVTDNDIDVEDNIQKEIDNAGGGNLNDFVQDGYYDKDGNPIDIIQKEDVKEQEAKEAEPTEEQQSEDEELVIIMESDIEETSYQARATVSSNEIEDKMRRAIEALHRGQQVLPQEELNKILNEVMTPKATTPQEKVAVKTR